jgi:very-short-patch-repair endonuclease
MRGRACPKGSAHRPSLLASRARSMRHNPTFPEERLFEAIKGRRLGVQFKRQVAIGGRFIVDLLAPEVRLVVEVNGDHHDWRRRADAGRDQVLRRLGYRVLRLNAELVHRELPVAVARIEEEVARWLMASTNSPSASGVRPSTCW